MAFFDLPLEQLVAYRPQPEVAPDFDDFWTRTLQQARTHDLNAQFQPVDEGLKLVEIYDVTFSGYGGQPVKGWFVLPKDRSGPLPCVVEYIGYGGGRGFGFDFLLWANAGYASLRMDTRGQGSAWGAPGDTPDLAVDGTSNFYPGFMTQGILSPETYYYRRLFTDAARAVEAARSHPAVDRGRIAVTGSSQGGGISIAAAALFPDVQAVLPDVPFLCHYRRAVSIVDSMPYGEITNFLKVQRDRADQVFYTLSYFDGVNFAARTTAAALYSVGLMDTVCPPSTVYAAYNHHQGPKDIRVYAFNHHEGGGSHHTREKLRFLDGFWGGVASVT